MSDAHKLKGLQTRRRSAALEVSRKQEALERAKKDFAKAEQDLAEVDRQIEALTGKGLVVSEHAMLRFVERVLGITPEDIQRRIVTEDLRRLHLTLGSGKYPIEGGAKAVIRGNVVTTVEKD